ncbi:hypothetical protein C6P40_002969 [Pichia californica]|uniref:Fork-head domain-containing protein n=1 Tax=Pichia californica TaxID=460514 RepID=A0A9P6WH11_9ASCO|nr:hypothetical protein C6P40_002969 [[Candida] californica]
MYEQLNYQSPDNYHKEKGFSLLPPANLSSPTKKYELKTPPHSTRRGVSSLTAINRGDSTNNNNNNNNNNKNNNNNNNNNNSDNNNNNSNNNSNNNMSINNDENNGVIGYYDNEENDQEQNNHEENNNNNNSNDDDNESYHTFSHHHQQHQFQPHMSVISNYSSSFYNGNQINSITSNPGLLSPEFSSPNLYEHIGSQEINKSLNNNLDNNNNNDDDDRENVFQASNINIRIISDSPLMDNSSDKENLRFSNGNHFVEPLEAPKFTKKRSSSAITSSSSTTSSSSSFSSSSSSNKKSRLVKSPDGFILPEPHQMPEIHFESSAKPPYSYASLIGMALLRSPERRLTLAEIYKWISDNFKYYKKGEVGWQNSIRHNLSLNKAFEKTEKSKEKKGHFWQIVSGFEHVYCTVKESKRNNTTSTSTIENIPVSSINSNVNITQSSNLVPPSTPKAKKSENFDENSKVDVNVSTPKNTTNNITQHLSSTPQITYSNSKLLNYTSINPQSRSHSRNPSTTLGSIPELNIQYSSSFNASINASPINFQYDSPSRGSNTIDSSTLDFTSSFSCRSNFELSPIRSFEAGPILEPITPNRSFKSSQNVQLPSISKQLQTLQPLVQNKVLLDLQSNSSTSIKFNNNNNINNSNNNGKFKTPLKITNTPITNSNSSMARKLWASPSYLDDFYTSPCFNNNNNNNNNYNVINKNNNSNTANKVLPLLQTTSHINFHNTLYGSPLPLNKRKLISKANSNITNGYSTNEIFGIDVCTIHHHDDERDR